MELFSSIETKGKQMQPKRKTVTARTHQRRNDMRILVGFGRCEKGKIVESGEKLAIERQRQRLRVKANHTTPHHTKPSQAIATTTAKQN